MTIVRVTLVLGGTAAYLGLAILGWGGWTAFFAHPARVALAVALAVLAGGSLFADGNLSPGVREDRGNRWVIGALILIGLLAAYPYSDTCRTWSSSTKVYGGVKHHFPLSLVPGKPRFYVGKFGQHTKVTL